MRQTMEAHHSNPTCNTCHQIFEPIGLAFENFDAVGMWRTLDEGQPIDASGVLVDGTLYISGQIGVGKDGKIPADFDAEVKASLENVGNVLRASAMDFSDAVSVQVYLTDMALFQRMNVSWRFTSMSRRLFTPSTFVPSTRTPVASMGWPSS